MPTVASGGVVRGYGAVSGASSLATAVTASSTIDAKGSAVELTAATEIEAHWLQVDLVNATTTGNFLVDLMVGAAGQEVVVVPDMGLRSRTSGSSLGGFLFPVHIPKGVRLSARAASSAGGFAVGVSVNLFGPGPAAHGSPPPPFVTAYGATANSRGTLVDPSAATVDTDSPWTEITAATERDHHWLALAGWYGDIVLGVTTHWRVTLGIGAATEQVLAGPFHLSADNTTDLPFNPVQLLPVFVPKGSRITARGRCNVISNDRQMWLKVYGCG